MQKSKQIAGAVASVKRDKRKLTRKENRELEKVDQRFDSLCNEFVEFLFSWDWDDPKGVVEVDDQEVPIYEFNPFGLFNDDWRYFAKNLNENKKHQTPVNGEAFYDTMINNENLNYGEPIDINNPRLNQICYL